MCVCFVLLMVLRPLRSTPTDTRFSYTTLFRSAGRGVLGRRWGSAPGKLWWRGAAVWRSEGPCCGVAGRSEEHTSELHSLMRISYAVFCLQKKPNHHRKHNTIRRLTLEKQHLHTHISIPTTQPLQNTTTTT